MTATTDKMKNVKTTKLGRSRGIGRPTRADYEEILAGYEERLAAAKSEFDRVDRAGDVARAAYFEARGRHVGTLREVGYQVSRLVTTVDQFEARKIRLTAELAASRAALGAAGEAARARYGRVLADLRQDGEFLEIKYKATALNNARRDVVLDEIVAVEELKDRLVQEQRDGLYAAEQIQISENFLINSNQERNLQNWTEKVKNEKMCADLIEILNNQEKKNMMKHDIIKSRDNYHSTKQEKDKFVHLHKSIKLESFLYLLEKDEYSLSMFNLMYENYKRATEQKKITQQKKNQLIDEAFSQKILREEYSKNVKSSVDLGSNENQMIDLLNDLKTELLKVKDFRKQKLDYLKIIHEEIAIIKEKTNKFMIGELKDIDWLLNRGVVRHFDGQPEYIS